MTSDIQELERLKKEIDTAKTGLAREEGKLQALMEKLEKEFGLTSVEEAEEKAAALVLEIRELEIDISERLKDLKAKYEW
jgi:uncharacterized protein YpuA (DUF1002 family)